MLSIVLSRSDFREYDQMVTLYTKEKGKVEALAKGIKKITSKNSAALMPFCLLEVEVLHGKEVDHITKAQTIKNYLHIFKDLKKVSVGQYALGLVNEFILPYDRDENIFNLLLNFFEFLDSVERANSFNLATGFIYKLWHYFGFTEENFWLKSDWKEINNADEKKVEYESACVYAESHVGRKLGRIIDGLS